MFTKVHLKNFRSFEEIEFDLCGKARNTKPLAIVFGENGIGKSNLMSSFAMLSELLVTMDMRDAYEDFLSQKAIFFDENVDKAYKKRVLDGFRDIQAIINDCRMVGTVEPVVAEFDFLIGEYSGKYKVELGKSEITHERLEYRLNQRRGVYFECSEDGLLINGAIVKSRDLLKDIKATAKRFWGKHSLLAIILYELRDKSKAYGEANISENFRDVIAELAVVSCLVKIGNRQFDSIQAPLQILEEPVKGNIPTSSEKELDAAERMFTTFFSAINSDIKSAFYKRGLTDKYIEYELCFEKKIAGKYRTIEFYRESTGNYQLLKILCYFLTACLGGIVILDEADSGIHDILFKKILQDIRPYIRGQIIMTSHNTVLMESEFAHSATYFMDELENGKKVIRSVSDYEKRTFQANNIRSKYLNDEYGGMPSVKDINFEAVLQEVEKYIE